MPLSTNSAHHKKCAPADNQQATAVDNLSFALKTSYPHHLLSLKSPTYPPLIQHSCHTNPTPSPIYPAVIPHKPRTNAALTSHEPTIPQPPPPQHTTPTYIHAPPHSKPSSLLTSLSLNLPKKGAYAKLTLCRVHIYGTGGRGGVPPLGWGIIATLFVTLWYYAIRRPQLWRAAQWRGWEVAPPLPH